MKTTLTFEAQEFPWLSTSVWASSVDDLEGSSTTPWIGGRYLVGASLVNTGEIFGQNEELLFYRAPSGLGFCGRPARLIGRSHVSAGPMQTVDVLCQTPWRAPHFFESQEQLIVSLNGHTLLARRNLIIACALGNKFVVNIPLASSLQFNPACLTVGPELPERVASLVYGLDGVNYFKPGYVTSWWFQDAKSGNALSLAGSFSGNGALLHLEYRNADGGFDGVSILIVDGQALGALVDSLGKSYEYRAYCYGQNRAWQRH